MVTYSTNLRVDNQDEIIVLTKKFSKVFFFFLELKKKWSALPISPVHATYQDFLLPFETNASWSRRRISTVLNAMVNMHWGLDQTL